MTEPKKARPRRAADIARELDAVLERLVVELERGELAELGAGAGPLQVRFLETCCTNLKRLAAMLEARRKNRSQR